MAIPEESIDSILNLIEEERYQDAKDFLSSVIPMDTNSHHLYYLKAICSIYMNQLDEALIDLGEVSYLNPNHTPSMHALAYIFLKKGDFPSAINKWISIQKTSPKDSLSVTLLKKVKDKKLTADPFRRYHIQDYIQLDFKSLKKALSLNFTTPEPIKKNTSSKFSDHNHQEKIIITPTIPIKKTYKKKDSKQSKILKISFLTLALGIIISTFIYYKYIENKEWQNIKSNLKHFVQNNAMSYTYTDREIELKKKRILELVRSNEYNTSTILINQFYTSNASLKDKEKVKIWEGMLKHPHSASEIDQNITLSTIYENPVIYQGVYIYTEGKASNLKVHLHYTSFDLTDRTKHHIKVILLDDKNNIGNNDIVAIFGSFRLNNENEALLEAYDSKIKKINIL